MAVPTSTTTKQKINGKNNKAEAVIKIKVMLRGLCSASSIFLSRLFNKDNDNYQKNGRS